MAKRSTTLKNPHYPQTLYAVWREYGPNDPPTLSADSEATALATDVGEDLRVAVYQLVGYVDVQNRTIASDVQPLKAKGK